MYRIRTYNPADRERVGLLLRRLWSLDDAQNRDYLIWRYEKNPCLETCLAVAESEGEIVAVRGACGLNWRVGDGTESMPCLGDTVVDQAHEGRGLVQKLTRHLFSVLEDAGVRYVVNQSPGKLVEKISLRTGWKRVGDRKLTRMSNLSAGKSSFKRLDANASLAADSVGERFVVEREPPRGLVELLTRKSGSPPISHLWDDAYNRWRFKNPYSQYRWLCAYADGLTGFMVIARSTVAGRKSRFRILDIWGTNHSVQAGLLRWALDWGEFREVLVWWNRFPREVVQVLLDSGFKASRDEQRNPTVLVKEIGGTGDYVVNGVSLLEMRNWDARMIHSDVT